MSNFNEGMRSSATDDWATPQDVFDKLHAEFQFTVDAASSDENAKLPRHWTKQTDGLLQSWAGESVFCNPPYGRGIGEWCRKAAECKADVAVLLIPARTDTKWWHEWVMPQAEIRFIRGRLKFGGHTNSAPFPSAIAVYRPGST